MKARGCVLSLESVLSQEFQDLERFPISVGNGRLAHDSVDTTRSLERPEFASVQLVQLVNFELLCDHHQKKCLPSFSVLCWPTDEFPHHFKPPTSKTHTQT